MHVLYGIAAYLAAGLLLAVAFVSFGLSRVLAEARPATIGARLILIPGAAVLWPYVAIRWIRGRSAA